MIYLFEDRKGRMDISTKVSFEESLVRLGIIDCVKENLRTFIDTNFNDAKAVIFHSSYCFNDGKITNEDVKNSFLSKKVPFVYFSGGLSNNLVAENQCINGTVNSGDMYNNLSGFIEAFEKSGRINIPLLVYGNRYLMNSLLEVQTLIMLILFSKQGDDYLDEGDVYAVNDIIEVRLLEPELYEDKQKLIEWLDPNRMKIKKSTLTGQIQKLIAKYQVK